MDRFKCQLCGIDVDGYVAYGDKYRSNNSTRLKNGIYCYGACEEYALRKLEKQFNYVLLSNSYGLWTSINWIWREIAS